MTPARPSSKTAWFRRPHLAMVATFPLLALLVPAVSLPAVLLIAPSAVDAADDDPAWSDDVAAAVQSQGARPIALLFSSAGCGWCERMLAESDHSPEVRQALHQVAAAHVQAEQFPALVAALGITGFPTLVLVNRKGELVRLVTGYLPPGDLAVTLRVLVQHGDEEGQRPIALRGADISAILQAPDAQARLIALLGVGDIDQRRQVRAALAAMPTARNALWTALGDPALGVRVDAAAALAAQIGAPPAPGFDPFAPPPERVAAMAAWRAQAGAGADATPAATAPDHGAPP